jgi:small subunit ribosomal protein S1
MIKNRDRVYDKAEEMAAKYREKMRAQQQGIPPASITLPVDDAPEAIEVAEEDIEIPEDLELPSATEDE